MLFFNRKYILTTGALLLLTASIVLYLYAQDRQKEPEDATSFPTPTIVTYPAIIKRGLNLPDLSSAPTLSPDKGLGIDTNSPAIKASEAEINKAYPLLPYSANYNLSTGIRTSVVIPQKELQDNPWTLLIQIFGIDYETPPTDEGYDLTKASFLESAHNTIDFLKQKGIDTNKVFIVWGDKQNVRVITDSWLKEP